MLPLIPALASLVGLTGAGTLIWYYSKSESERSKLDRKADELARAWYDRNADQLSAGQLRKVFDEVKKISKG